MGKSLRNTGREILYSLCEWGRENPATWAHDLAGAHSWRISGDIQDDWESIVKIATIATPLWRFAGPSLGFNDPDMLEVGNNGCSLTEYKSHFSMWAMLKAPLITGNDLRKLDKDGDVFKILSNIEVIAVNQDSLGWQSRRVWSDSHSDSHSAPDSEARGGDTGGDSTYSTRDRLIATKCTHRVTLSSTENINNMQLDQPVDQEWSIGSDGKIRSNGSNMCLTEMQPSSFPFPSNATETGSDVHIADDLDTQCYAAYCVGTRPCDDPSTTRWDVQQFTRGMITSQSTGRCLEVNRDDSPYVEDGLEVSVPAQGKRVQTGVCQVNTTNTTNTTTVH